MSWVELDVMCWRGIFGGATRDAHWSNGEEAIPMTQQDEQRSFLIGAYVVLCIAGRIDRDDLIYKQYKIQSEVQSYHRGKYGRK